MDKIEYREKLREIKQLAENNNYEQAAQMIFEINWRKVKSASTLCQVGTILGKAGYYEQGKELLLMAYDKAPVGKAILYQLVELTIREKDIEEAEKYFTEYTEIDPDDVKRYKLEYKLSVLKGANTDEQIRLLEIIKDKEFTEEGSYELANLYHKAGRVDECIKACDDIILWFGEGPYVEKAMELKMLYTPLTGYQAEKYEEFKYQRQGLTRIKPTEVSGYAEILHDDVTIPEIKTNVTKYNTINLQAELAKEMQQIMDATEQETVNSSMDNIRKLVEDSKLTFLEPKAAESQELYQDIESDEDIDASLKLNFREILAEEYDGQISTALPDAPLVDKQITGQMSIEDVLAEWEKTKKAAESAMEEARVKKLENAKARALAQTGNIMDKINEALPELEAASQVAESSAVATEINLPQPEIEIPDISASAAFAAAGVSLEQEYEDDDTDTEENADAFEEELVTEEPASEIDEEQTEDMDNELTEEPEQVENIAEDAAQTAIDNLDKALEREADREARDTAIEEMTTKEITISDEDAPIERLDDVQKGIFTYFIAISGMERQICSVLEGVRNRKRDETSGSGNIIIEGEQRCGKTMMATNLTQAIQELYPHQSNKVGKIQAESLNNKSVSNIIEKIYGGYLIIENASLLTKSKAQELADAMGEDTGGLLVILEDTRHGLVKALSLTPDLASKFTEKIHIPIFTNDELVVFAKNYAIEQGYVIDEMGILALYNRIGNIRIANKATTLEEVKDIVDEAIDNAERKPITNAFRSIFTSRYDEDENLILREKDFGA